MKMSNLSCNEKKMIDISIISLFALLVHRKSAMKMTILQNLDETISQMSET